MDTLFSTCCCHWIVWVAPEPAPRRVCSRGGFCHGKPSLSIYKQHLGVEFSGLKVESENTRNLVNPYRCLSQVPDCQCKFFIAFATPREFGIHHKKASNAVELRLLE